MEPLSGSSGLRREHTAHTTTITALHGSPRRGPGSPRLPTAAPGAGRRVGGRRAPVPPRRGDATASAPQTNRPVEPGSASSSFWTCGPARAGVGETWGGCGYQQTLGFRRNNSWGGRWGLRARFLYFLRQTQGGEGKRLTGFRPPPAPPPHAGRVSEPHPDLGFLTVFVSFLFLPVRAPSSRQALASAP